MEQYLNRKPNILFILTDQHRLSAIGSYGDTPCKTPNLDRLAAEGVNKAFHIPVQSSLPKDVGFVGQHD